MRRNDMMKEQRPKLATATLIFKEDKVLLGCRRGDGEATGTYGAPGGHVEHLESLVDSAIREVVEEAAIEVENVSVLGVVNVRDFAPAHYVVLVLRADWKSGDPVTCEPDKCEGWEWYAMDALPEPLTPATKKGIESLKNGRALFAD